MTVPRGQPPVLKSKGLISRQDYLAWLSALDDPDVILIGASTALMCLSRQLCGRTRTQTPRHTTSKCGPVVSSV